MERSPVGCSKEAEQASCRQARALGCETSQGFSFPTCKLEMLTYFPAIPQLSTDMRQAPRQAQREG